MGRNRRTGRYPAILDRILPVLHDRSGHRTLFEPDPDAAPANVTMHTQVRFYAFAIWIGMGGGIAQWLQGKLGEKPASVIATVVCLFVPIQMVSQTWDDHDRSNRYVARDFGQKLPEHRTEEGKPDYLLTMVTTILSLVVQPGKRKVSVPMYVYVT